MDLLGLYLDARMSYDKSVLIGRALEIEIGKRASEYLTQKYLNKITKHEGRDWQIAFIKADSSFYTQNTSIHVYIERLGLSKKSKETVGEVWKQLAESKYDLFHDKNKGANPICTYFWYKITIQDAISLDIDLKI